MSGWLEKRTPTMSNCSRSCQSAPAKTAEREGTDSVTGTETRQDATFDALPVERRA